MSRTEYPIELQISFDDDAVTITHGTAHGAGVYQYRIDELDPTTLDNLLGHSDEVVIYTQGESYTKEEFQALYGNVDLSTLVRVHEGEGY